MKPVTAVAAKAFVIALVSIALSGVGFHAHATGIITNDPSLPPIGGEYRTAADVHAEYNGGSIVLETIRHFGFTSITRFDLGIDEHEQFNSNVTGLANGNPIGLMGPVHVKVLGKAGMTTGTFDTEMLSMDLTGGGIMIRESPTLASTGKTTITPLGGGMFQIDSFFDIFTELSLDGGTTFIPNDGSPTHVTLQPPIPEPTSVLLLATGILGTAGYVWRRNRKRGE